MEHIASMGVLSVQTQGDVLIISKRDYTQKKVEILYYRWNVG